MIPVATGYGEVCLLSHYRHILEVAAKPLLLKVSLYVVAGNHLRLVARFCSGNGLALGNSSSGRMGCWASQIPLKSSHSDASMDDNGHRTCSLLIRSQTSVWRKDLR